MAITLIDMYHIKPDCFGTLGTFRTNTGYMDGTVFCNMLLTRYATCEVVYPTGDLFKQMCESFYDRYAQSITDMADALNYVSQRAQKTDAFTVTETKEGSNSANGTGTNAVSAFNDSDYSPDTKQTQNTSGTYKETITKSPSGKSVQNIATEQFELYKYSDIWEWLANNFADEMLVCCW